MKKVLSIVALTLIAILAGTIILFSCVNKDFNLQLTNPDSIKIYVNSTDSETYEKDSSSNEHKEVYNKVMNLYNQSFKQKMMSSIFSGILFEKATITKEYKSNFNSGVFVVFQYKEAQTLKLDGKVYTYKSGNTEETNIQYKTLYVEVKNTDSMTTFNIYVEKLDATYSYYHYTVRAKQAELYNYLTNLNA